MSDRKNISLSGDSKRIFEQLEKSNFFDINFDGFSSFVQHQLKKAHKNPEKVILESKKQQKKELEREINQLEERVEEFEDNNDIDKKKQSFVQKFVDRIEEFMNNRREKPNDFYPNYNKLEKPFITKATNKGLNFTKKELKDSVEKEAEKRDLI